VKVSSTVVGHRLPIPQKGNSVRNRDGITSQVTKVLASRHPSGELGRCCAVKCLLDGRIEKSSIEWHFQKR
jgi:hypothetical protein